MDSTVNTDGTSVGSSSEAGRNTTDTPNTTDTTASTGANGSTGNATADLSSAGAEASTAAGSAAGSTGSADGTASSSTDNTAAGDATSTIESVASGSAAPLGEDSGADYHGSGYNHDSGEPSSGLDDSTSAQGIPSVAGQGLAPGVNKSRLIGSICFLIAGMALIGFFLWYFFFKNDAAANEADTPTAESQMDLTSNASITRLPLSEILKQQEEIEPDDTEEQEIEPEPKPEPEPEPEPETPIPVPLATKGLGAMLEEEHIPTLEELKFAAPMMGMLQSSPASALSSSPTDPSAYPGLGASANIGGDSYALGGFGGGGGVGGGEEGSTPGLASRLNAVSTPSTTAHVLRQQSLTLSKGTVIECILESRVDTTVPGMTTCVIPRDIYSMNGRVLLIEKGTKAIGEYQGAVQNGLARIFMLWTELRTPHGVSIALNSPSADALGGSGMGGYVDYHWWKRFGNALLFSMIADGFQYAVTTQQNNSNNGDITYENTESGIDEIIQEAMRQSGNIPPTLIKNQGERVSIFVARDLNFSSVYGVQDRAYN